MGGPGREYICSVNMETFKCRSLISVFGFAYRPTWTLSEMAVAFWLMTTNTLLMDRFAQVRIFLEEIFYFILNFIFNCLFNLIVKISY